MVEPARALLSESPGRSPGESSSSQLPVSVVRSVPLSRRALFKGLVQEVRNSAPGYPRRLSAPPRRQGVSSPSPTRSNDEPLAALPSQGSGTSSGMQPRCLSVRGLLPRSSRFLKWRNDSGNAVDRSLREFLEVMVGPQPDSANPGFSGLCLTELTPEVLRDEILPLVRERASSGPIRGLVLALQPYLEDLLTRRQSFRGAVDVLAAAADSDASLPRALTEMTTKDLFLALMLVAPRQKGVRLAMAFSRLRSPLPVLFRVCWSQGSGEIQTITNFEVLHEMACTPRANRQVFTSLGTTRVAGCGKTTLLGVLSFTPTAIEDLDVRPGGPLHTGSCDLLCGDDLKWVLDVQGSWAGSDLALQTAVLSFALWSNSVCLVHCALADFHPTSLVPKKELQALLSSLSTACVPPPSGVGGEGNGPLKITSIIILVRDTADSDFASKRAGLEAALKSYPVIACIAVEDFQTLRSTGRRTTAAERLKARIEAPIASAALRSVGTPCLEELHRIHRALAEQGLGPGSAFLFGSGNGGENGGMNGTKASSSSATNQPRQSALGREFTRLLDEAWAGGKVASTLFPLSALKRRWVILKKQISGAGGHEGELPAMLRGAHMLEQLKAEAEEAEARSCEMQDLEDQLKNGPCSNVMAFFRRVVAGKEHEASLRELATYLEEWKEPKVVPLLDKQRELLDRASHATDPEMAKVVADLAELDFGMDSFWPELELLEQRASSAEASEAASFAKAKICLQSWLSAGQPFQLLHSRPLQMASHFLRGVLEAVGAPHSDTRGIYVVSVIGAQSSAKSTLLNFLFGCGFAVRAGRCTKGLYASYLAPTNGSPPMLILDSEGLLSLGSEGSVFDGQIALMCMTCSHLVLVNHKGELSRQLQDLLEVCLFAMRHLRLARTQPRLAFVLRDQHDRSRGVHEDMLKQMRNHLEDAARTLGSPLHELILLDSTAIFLLPSAVTSELRQGQEVCWTSELFAREVLHLRSEVFRWLGEDATRRQGSHGPSEFSSLGMWLDYAVTVWETLEQFGEQLLHYRTIHDIELRRELADVAKTAVRDALEGGGSEGGGAAGFHARARQMVDSFVARMHANPSKLDLETTDLELSRALACLRDEFVAQLEEIFQERASSPRFSATAKEQAKQQIRTPIEWAFENHLYTWKLHLKKASDERAMHELWVHFTGVLNRHLAHSGHRSCLSKTESQALFEEEWQSYESSYRTRLTSLIKEWQTLAHEVTLLFNHAVGKLQHEAGPLALLKEVGPQQVALHQGDGRAHGMPGLLEQSDEEWAEQYFYLGFWNTVKMKGLAFLQSADSDGATMRLRSHIIPRMKQTVQQGLQQLRAEIVTRGALDEATVAESLRHVAVGILNDLETRLMTDSSVTLKRPQLLHALHVSLRVACVEALMVVEEDKQRKAMEDLLAQKALIEEHFLLIVQANKGDVERATNFATLYHRSLTNWLDHEVTQLAADVRSQVLQEMPDPQKSAERAFQQSFAASCWPDVLEYVLDMNAYLEKCYLTVFHQRKRAYVGAAKSRVERRVLSAYRLLIDEIGDWSRRESETSSRPTVDVVKGSSRLIGQKSIKDLKRYISTHAEKIPPNAESAESHRQLAERIPATADFQIADVQLFSETLQARIAEFADSPEIHNRLATKLDKALRDQSVQAWSLIRGCSEHCPLCGSKCDLVGEHARHHCSHHLFPAFHGWMDRNTGLPSFNYCLATETREGTYECKDGTWRKLEDYLRTDHPSWLPFVRQESGAASDRDAQYLRAAWVNCREALLEYFSPMADGCPESWVEDYLDKGRALTKADLQTAKDTIRKLRNHTWSPSVD